MDGKKLPVTWKKDKWAEYQAVDMYTTGKLNTEFDSAAFSFVHSVFCWKDTTFKYSRSF